MAAKTVFAVVAVLCAFAAAAGIPLLSHNDGAGGLDPQLKFDWNATEIMEKIQQAVIIVQNKIQEVSEEVRSAVQAIAGSIEAAAVKLVAKWKEAVQKWADQAAQAGVDIQECLNQQESRSYDIIIAIKSETQKCSAKSIEDLAKALERVKAVGPLAQAVIDEARTKVAECQKKGDPKSIGLCLVGTVAKIQIKATLLAAEATLLAGVATAAAVAVPPSVSVCTASATSRHSAEGKAIVDETISCIKEKLNA